MTSSSSNLISKLRLFEPVSKAAAIAILLKDALCCARCILRFLGEKNLEVYRSPRYVLNETIDLLGRDKKSAVGGSAAEDHQGTTDDNNVALERDLSETVCVTCLGVLQDFCDATFVERLNQKIKDSSYQFKEYSLAIALPLSFMIRQHSIWIYLQEQFSDTYKSYSQHEDIISVKEAYKWICGGLLDQNHHVAFKYKSPFEVKIQFTHSESASDESFIHNFHQRPPSRKRHKCLEEDEDSKSLTITSVSAVLNSISLNQFKTLSSCPPKPTSAMTTYDIEFNHQSVFLAGRYNKYSRTISQTPWILDGVRKVETSVQELLCEPIVTKMKADGCKFSSSGREDVDVRMLGDGRPFIVELLNPRQSQLTQQEVTALQVKVNQSTDKVRVNDLQVINRYDASKLKEGEENKCKTYCALIYCNQDIDESKIQFLNKIQDLVIEQKTPLRVLHRRTSAIRSRAIRSMRTNFIDERHFKLYLKTQAGTYIKEFVHGDMGRTQPNLCTLLNMTLDILELDVESIDLDWPPKIDEANFVAT